MTYSLTPVYSWHLTLHSSDICRPSTWTHLQHTTEKTSYKYTRLEQCGVDTSEQDEVEQAIKDMHVKGFMDLVEDIRGSAFGPRVWRHPKEKYASNTVDGEFLSHARYLQR